jgi:hypothetical protein
VQRHYCYFKANFLGKGHTDIAVAQIDDLWRSSVEWRLMEIQPPKIWSGLGAP